MISTHIMKKIDFRHYATERLSGFVFYVLIGLIVVLGLLFRLIGYDMPYEYNFDYNAPLLTGAVVTFMLLLTGGTLVLMVWTMIRGMRINGDENRVVNNIPARRISVCVALGTLLLLVLTFALSSTDALKVNGAAYTDTFWLRASGMFVGTSLLMIVAAIAAVVYGATRYIRKSH